MASEWAATNEWTKITWTCKSSFRILNMLRARRLVVRATTPWLFHSSPHWHFLIDHDGTWGKPTLHLGPRKMGPISSLRFSPSRTKRRSRNTPIHVNMRGIFSRCVGRRTPNIKYRRLSNNLVRETLQSGVRLPSGVRWEGGKGCGPMSWASRVIIPYF